jgi:hypothetical protein
MDMSVYLSSNGVSREASNPSGFVETVAAKAGVRVLCGSDFCG